MSRGAARKQKALPAFLQNVLEILEECPPEVAGWNRVGDSFLVHDVVTFARDYLSVHFKSGQFTSFVRQLNFYGFHKLASDNKRKWEFKHECFIRGRPDLMHCIKRKTSADYHTAGKGEISTLRMKVGMLTGSLERANQRVAALTELLTQIHGSDLMGMSVPAHVVEALESQGIKAATSSGWADARVPAAPSAAPAPANRDAIEMEAVEVPDTTRRSSSTVVTVPRTTAPVEAAPALVRGAIRGHARSASGGGDEPFEISVTSLLDTLDDEDSDLDDADERRAQGRTAESSTAHGNHVPVKRRRVFVAVPTEEEARELSVMSPGGFDLLTSRMGGPGVQHLKVAPATTADDGSLTVENIESITSAFTSSLDFTGAGIEMADADDSTWAWADNSESRPLTVKVSSLTSAAGPFAMTPKGASPRSMDLSSPMRIVA